MPWCDSRMARLSPSAAEMISPSSLPTGTPGQSFRKATSPYSGQLSMCEISSGTSSIDKDAACSGCVWMMQFTSGRAR